LLTEFKLEGVVITGMDFMKKWKIGEEDESKWILKLSDKPENKIDSR
jgi:hypothetical protein